jgi:thioredoxin 1
MIELTDDSFQEEVEKCDIPVLVDFWSTWCNPCKMMAPILEEVEEHFSDKIKVCKANVEDVPDVISEYMVAALPTLILIKDGNVIKKEVGLKTKDALISMIEEVL